MKRTIILICMSTLLFGSCNNAANKKAKDAPAAATETTPEVVNEPASLAFDPATLPEEPVFEMVTNKGTMVIKLYKETPLHRDNFVKLASEHYYDNLLFHRVINGFMIQGGDPASRGAAANVRLGSGGPGYTIPAEFNSALKHKKGALAAARTGDSTNPQKASSGSQFYIVQDPVACAQLDGNYTVYGEVIEGIEVIDAIANVQTGASDRPVSDVVIMSVLPKN